MGVLSQSSIPTPIFMKHIKNLILNNFQQWKKGNIQFKEGLNVIVGNTESGKSTLFRAINSILTGKMPEDYVRKGTKGCEVEVQFSDDTFFKRSRTKKDNIANANGVIFERVGKEIPFEYFNKLGKTSIEFGSKELSLCSYSQFEPHFFRFEWFYVVVCSYSIYLSLLSKNIVKIFVKQFHNISFQFKHYWSIVLPVNIFLR